MRYHLLATDYDGTLADQGQVSNAVIDKLKQFQATGRKAILVTGREMKDLVEVFPAYKIFDYIVAENGALIHETATGRDQLLGPAPDPSFVRALEDKGVRPISVGQVIIATWEPYEQVVLDAIKSAGIERQVIFNKGAVMILPTGINKATGLQSLLHNLHLSLHNTVAVGDAENDGAMLLAAECGVAVSNALPALKSIADWVTDKGHGEGVMELMDRLMENDLVPLARKSGKDYLPLGLQEDGTAFAISPYRSGILVSGVSGGGKTTLTLSIVESMVHQGYQFCLLDPEGDYLELPGSIVLGNGTSLPSIDEIKELLKDPAQNLVICTLSIPLVDRPSFFAQLMPVLLDLRRRYGHPHWILLDEAHHLIPAAAGASLDWLTDDFNNFIIISTSPHALGVAILSKVGLILTIGGNAAYPIEQFCEKLELKTPTAIPSLEKNELCVWEREESRPPYKVRFNQPSQLQQRHKKKYAQGDMGANSFIFTGPDNKLHLVANNLILFMHLAEGIDDDTWQFHLHRQDYTRWFGDVIHDKDLASAGEEADQMDDPSASRKHIVDFIAQNYTA